MNDLNIKTSSPPPAKLRIDISKAYWVPSCCTMTTFYLIYKRLVSLSEGVWVLHSPFWSLSDDIRWHVEHPFMWLCTQSVRWHAAPPITPSRSQMAWRKPPHCVRWHTTFVSIRRSHPTPCQMTNELPLIASYCIIWHICSMVHPKPRSVRWRQFIRFIIHHQKNMLCILTLKSDKGGAPMP